ncbi:MAG: DUF4832 domain-containing protein [Verrucomicrobiales bacterium]|nr:DUF4832 domain-containing protein [Verrucomicrobiales bacterium]
MRLILFLIFAVPSFAQQNSKLEYAPAPPDNPLKGFVPYVEIDGWDRFPHSLEYHYFAMNRLMTGLDAFDWSPIEEILEVTQKRGCQLIFRVYLEYPGKPNAVPEFLIEQGVKITKWKGDSGVSHTPDYESPKLRKAMADLIAAMGKQFDGDPRIGFLQAGVLGSWGEWHTYPRDGLWASKETQVMVLEAFEKEFSETPVLLRYPAKENHYAQAENVSRPFGYHDDSFAWATLETGREEDNWFFLPLLKAAGATEKWKTHPIGGELRPELWPTAFTGKTHPKEQDFDECARQTHVSWLLDTGLFGKKFPLPDSRKQNAIRAAQRMGYEFHVSEWKRTQNGRIEITVENRGVAPFYQDWPAELVAFSDGAKGKTIAKFDLRGILPGEKKTWKTESDADAKSEFRLRVKNPMEGGKPLRFANRELEGEWLVLPKITLP